MAANSGWRRVLVTVEASDEVVHEKQNDEAFLTRSPSVLASRYRVPSSGKMSVLLCGEGDFSFARALASSVCTHKHENFVTITATSYEPKDEITNEWGGEANMTALSGERFGGFVEVLHSVDATALDTRFKGTGEVHVHAHDSRA